MNHKTIISSAANAYSGYQGDEYIQDIVLPDNCHMGRNMQSFFKLAKHLGLTLIPMTDLGDRGQGFIDNGGNFHNRSDAYKIAKASGQPFNDDFTLPDNKLDSSCIRHFEYQAPWLEYVGDEL